MRKIVAVFVLVAGSLAPAAVWGQSHGGIIGGPGSAGFAAEDDSVQDATEADFAYSVGLQGRVNFQEFLSAKPELLFSRKTTRLEGRALGVDFKSTYAISYLEIPLLIRAAVPVADTFAPKVFAGPHASIFLDGRREGEASGSIFRASDSTDIDSEDVRNVQFGVTAGVGLDLNFETVVFTQGVRYVRNFTPIFEDPDSDDRIRHEVWLVMVGFMF